MLGCNFLLGYGLGSLNTALQLIKKHETAAGHFFRPQEDFSIAFSLVLWVSATLFLTGGILEKPIRLDPSKLTKVDIGYLYIVVLLYFGALATHQIGYLGASVSEEGHVGIVGAVAGMVGQTIPAMTVLLRKQTRLLRNNFVFWSVLVVEVAALLPSGRRMIIYAALTAVFALALTGFTWKASLWKKALVLGVCAVGFYSANLLFYAMRHVADPTMDAHHVGQVDIKLSDLVSSAWTYLREGRDSSFDEEVATNLRDRTFVLKYFSDLVGQSWTHQPLHGEVLAFAAGMTTPSAVVAALGGSKQKIIGLGMEENVANPAFGLKAQDEANSYLTVGVSDFGIPGVFIYPVLLVLALNFLVRVGLSRAPEVMRGLVVLMYIFALFQTEYGLTTIFVFTRDTFMLVIAWIPISKVLAFFMQSNGRPKAQPLAVSGSPTITLVRYEAVPPVR
jgi:hypothetical protein